MASMYEPPARIKHLVEGFELAERETATSAENLLSAPPRVLPFLAGADARIRSIPEAFLSRFDAGSAETHGQADDGKPVVTILATSRPTDLWIGDDTNTAELVAELIAGDLHCDVQMLDGTDFGSCVDRHREVANLYAGVNGPKARHDYIAEHFSTVPFDHHGTIVLARVCDWCLSALLAGVDRNRCGVLDAVDDGFGSVGLQQIEPSEYLWDSGYVRTLVDEYHAANGRYPTLAELSEGLKSIPFRPTAGESGTD